MPLKQIKCVTVGDGYVLLIKSPMSDASTQSNKRLCCSLEI